MTTPKIEKDTNPQGPIFEPFPEPRTMPDGWDLSEFNPMRSENIYLASDDQDFQFNIDL